MTDVRTTCPYCGVGCGVVATSRGDISGDRDHPANYGALCSKGAALSQTLGLEGRLLEPQIGGRQVTWGEALDLVAEKFSAAVRDYGPDSVAFYVSGQMLTEDYYVANKLMKGFIGSANIDTNSRLCMASSVAGHKRAFGSDTVPGNYEDLELADVIVLTGSNLAWCHPVLFQRILAAKARRPAMKIITIDPRVTPTSKASDLHLAIGKDGDTALFNALLVEIVRRGAINRQFIETHVNGFTEALNAAKAGRNYDIGLDEDEIQAFFDLWIGSRKTVTVYSQGVNQSVGGSDKVNAIINCHLATGRIGHPGMGPFSVTGQPNAMGGREVGGLANMLACHLDIENADHRATVQQFWNAPNICTSAGLKAVDLFEACDGGQIKALWVIGTNPVVSMPRADHVAKAIGNVDFVAISEVMAQTDTGILADVKLPATAWGEKSGTVTNSERRISRQRAFLPRPGNTRADWEIICEVGKRMGWREAFSYGGTDEIFREYASLSCLATKHGRDFDIGDLAQMDREQYENMSPIVWPVNSRKRREGRFFGDGEFFHDDGKARMIGVKAMAIGARAPGELRLNTGRIRDQWHTMTRSGKSSRLAQHVFEPFVQINPADAKQSGIRDADLVEIGISDDTEVSRLIVRAVVTNDVGEGDIFVPMHWGRAHASAARVNTLIDSDCDPFSGQPALKSAGVTLEKFDAKWYGFAASCRQIEAGCEYSAITKSDNGWRGEFAGVERFSDFERQVRTLLGIDDGDASVMCDEARENYRIAIYHDGKLSAIFFASPHLLEISRTHIITQINEDVPPLSVLAGLPIGQANDPGDTICACFNVGINTIKQAIAKGANTTVALGRCTAAGTNCGSCKGELQSLIDANQFLDAAQ